MITLWNKVVHKTKFVYMGLVMMMLFDIRMPSTKTPMLTCWHVDWRVSDRRTWICLCKMWNLTFLAINTKASCTTSWETIFFSTMGTTKKMNPHKVQRLTQMQCDKPRFKGWGKFNWVCNVVEKTCKINWKRRIVRQVENQPGLT